ncbi:hypothetical protein G6F65_021489 [Rhizopus arrhizus]|nr:hypothetical protein G6F65_021489 [Rhizopus arrhizus]
MISSKPNSAARLNMKQATAYGARRMTRLIRVIEISNTPSMARRSGATFSLSVSTMPMPNISAKNISDRIAPLSDAACSTLLGTIDSSMSMPFGVPWMPATISLLRSAFSDSIIAATCGSTPAPGLSTLTSTRPMPTAMPDSSTV